MSIFRRVVFISGSEAQAGVGRDVTLSYEEPKMAFTARYLDKNNVLDFKMFWEDYIESHKQRGMQLTKTREVVYAELKEYYSVVNYTPTEENEFGPISP